MSEPGNLGLVRYEPVGTDYLEKRQLRPSAGVVELWALGVGAVISSFFYGWRKHLVARAPEEEIALLAEAQ
jgi:ethanolamine permease